ncbi:MAG: Ig-like domain-containing protein [Bacteroidales bacterium]|nr:Ig-like domain-containing protein [Bacteroidales bacterium]
MMNRLLITSIFLCFFININAQYSSKYLNNPDLAKEVVLNEVDFWANYIDVQNGGFINEVSGSGSYSATSQKSFCSNSRIAYAFVRAFMLTGNTDYLDKARHALNFIYDFAWDSEFGGWYYAADYDGENPKHNMYNNGKWSYTQHYALLGVTAMNEATDGMMTWSDGRESDKTWLNRGLGKLNEKLWDNTPGIQGYFDIANNDWTNPHNKGFTPTADALTTHATVMALRDINPLYENNYFTLVDRIAYDIIPEQYTASSPLIYEYSNSNWEPFGQELFNGHAVKCAWNLSRAYLIDPSRTIYKEKAEQVIDELLARGYYDNANGGIHYFQTGGQKSHWTQEQGILAGILMSVNATDEAKKQKYISMADGCWKFMEDHMIDFTNGGSYTDVNTDGSVSGSFGKGDYWEAAYHTSETAYYTYLYGNVYLYNKPVELYYMFEPRTVAHVQKLTPFSIENNRLVIESVTLNGLPFTRFNAQTRELEIAANQGGKFKVTFKHNPDFFICPTLNLGADQSICGMSSTIIDSKIPNTGDVKFSWFKDGSLLMPPNYQTASIAVSSPGLYVLEIEGENCFKTDEIVISNEIPVFDLGESFVFTAAQSITTNLSSLYSHKWFKNNSEIANNNSNTLLVDGPGEYKVEVSSESCGSRTDVIVVSESPFVPFTYNSITVDGVKDSDYDANNSISNYVVNPTNATDLSATWSAVWDNAKLYVFIEVADDNLSNDGGNWWENDGIEIFIDGNNSKKTAYDKVNDFQWGFLWNGTAVQTGGSNPTGSTAGIVYTTKKSALGYICEVSIPWTTIGVTPQDGHLLGIEIGVNDDDLGGGRDSKIMWNGTNDNAWQNPSLFGEVLLKVEDANLIPVVSAGAARTVQMPIESTTLSGTITSGNPPYTIQWTAPEPLQLLSAGTVSPIVTNIVQAGIYEIVMQVTDADGDVASASMLLTVLAAPVAVTGVTIAQGDLLEVEVGKTASLTATVLPTNAANKAVVWASVNSLVATVSQTGLVTANAIGETQIVVTTVDGSFTDEITVKVIPADLLPIVSAGAARTVQMPIESTTLSGTITSGNPPYTIQWTAPEPLQLLSAGTVSPIVTNIVQAGVYEILMTVTDTDGDVASSSMLLTVLAAPVAVTGVTIAQGDLLEVEVGKTASLTANVLPANAANKAVVWSSVNSLVATVSQTGVVTANAIGETQIVVTTVDGAFTDEITIKVIPADLVPIVSAGAARTVQMPIESTTLSGTITSGNPPYTIQWTALEPLQLLSAGTVSPIVTNIVQAGIYEIVMQVTDADGDVASSSMLLTVLAAPVAVTGVTIAQGDLLEVEVGKTASLTATVLPTNAANKAVVWSSVNSLFATVSQTGVVTANAIGETQIVVTTVDGSFTDEITVNVIPADLLPIVSAGAARTVQMPIESTTLSGTITSGNPPYTIQWTAPEPLQLLSAGTVSPIVTNIVQAGIYEIVMQVTDADGDVASSSMLLTVLAAPVAVTGVTIAQGDLLEVEVGKTASLTATVLPTNAANKAVVWSSSNSSIVSVNALGSITAVTEGSATITVTTADGGFVDNIIVDVFVPENDCNTIPKPLFNQWVALNDWNDQSAGAVFTNTESELKFTQRAWGKNDVYLMQTAVPYQIVAGQKYSVSLDIKDLQSRVTSMKVGFATSRSWNAPTNYVVPLTSLPAGYSSSTFTNKSVEVTATATSNTAYLVIYLVMNTQNISTNYLLKNIAVCKSSLLKSSYSIIEEERLASESSVNVTVYPSPASEFINVRVENTENVINKNVIISSLLGIKIAEYELSDNDEIEINISELSSGIYYVLFGEEKIPFIVTK